jgi:tetratricopeptide (TPR) repeat protein
MKSGFKNRIIFLSFTGVFLLSFHSLSIADKYQDYLDKGQEQMTAGKYADAIGNFRKALKIRENSAQIYRDIAKCYLSLQMPDSAISYYEGAIVFNPRDIDAYQQVGAIYCGLKDNHEAMAWFERAMDLGQLTAFSYLTLGNIYFNWREYSRARDYYRLSIQVDSVNSDAYYGFGLSQIALNDTASALANLEKSTQVGSQPKAGYFIGMIEFDLGQFDSAGQWFNKYIQQDSTGEYSVKANEYLKAIKERKQK